MILIVYLNSTRYVIQGYPEYQVMAPNMAVVRRGDAVEKTTINEVAAVTLLFLASQDSAKKQKHAATPVRVPGVIASISVKPSVSWSLAPD
jgi:hypothetical protein